MHIKLFTGLLGLAMSAGLHAAVVFSGIQDIAIPAEFDGVYLDFDNYNDASDFAPPSTTEPASWDINLFFGGAAIATSDTFQPVTDTATTNAAALGLGSGDVVSGAGNFPPDFSGSLGHIGSGPNQWDNGDTAYLGFRLQPDSFPPVSQPATTIYGWMQVTLQNDGTPGMIHQWAWDPTGAVITVPEPSVAVFAGLAAAGLAFSRRRRQR